MLKEGTINGHLALWLENEFLKISVLPQKGADIYEFVHKASGVDFLMKTPAGLRPPGENPPADFLDNYEGGSQELFPNPGDPYDYQGIALPFDGEVALLPWDYSVERNPLQQTRALRSCAGERRVGNSGTATWVLLKIQIPVSVLLPTTSHVRTRYQVPRRHPCAPTRLMQLQSRLV